MKIFCNRVHNTVTLQIVSKTFRPNDGYHMSMAIIENMDFEDVTLSKPKTL